jgi:aspartate carbamoyltransferase regulatory subunit
MKKQKVYLLKEGTVIDHIPAGRSLKAIEILGIQNEGIITIGINYDSSRIGKKDIIKIENKKLSQKEINKLALIAPTATLNIIHDSKVIDKKRVEVPKFIEGSVKCPNPKCITNVDPVKTKFFVLQERPIIARCNYCERCVKEEEIKLI